MQARERALRAQYAPYDTFPEFEDGWNDYLNRWHVRPVYAMQGGVAEQAYDRGAEAAMQWERGG